jgi:hypothetical protein
LATLPNFPSNEDIMAAKNKHGNGDLEKKAKSLIAEGNAADALAILL